MSTDPFETSAGPYVLGALSPAERSAFVQHLEACLPCRSCVDDLAGLPGLLSRVDPGQLEHDEVPALPASLLPALLASVEQRERRRRWVATTLLAVAACALLFGVIGGVRRSEPPTPLAMRPLLALPLTASVGVTSIASGTRIGLRCSYTASDGVRRSYALVVLGRDGHRESVGTWAADPGSQVSLTADTSLRPDQIVAVEVQAPDGTALLRIDHPGTT